MEQRNLPKTMQEALELNSIGNNILQFILKQPHSPNILSRLAGKIGSIFSADLCIVVAARNSSISINAIGCWQGDLTEEDGQPQFEPPKASEVVQTPKDISKCPKGYRDPFIPSGTPSDNEGGRTAMASQARNRLTSIPAAIQKLSHLPFDSPKYAQKEVVEGTNSGLSQIIDDCLEKIPAKTWLGVITQYQQQTNGLVLLLKSGFSGSINSEQELLSQTSDAMAIAISQIQLQQKTQTQARYQSLLRNISREIRQSSHPQSLFETCLAQICTALELDRGMTLMLKYRNPLRAKHRQQQLVRGTARITSYWSAKGSKSPFQTEPSFDLNDSVLCQQAWHSAPAHLSFESGASFPDLTEQSIDSLQANGSALLMMPLMGKKSSDSDPAAVLGFLVLQYNDEHIWTEDELDLIDWVSVQLSNALVNHQTLTQVQSIVEERTSKLKWSLDVQAKLSTRMRQQIEQLQKLNLLKDDFMSSMSHELKTPLTSMKMAIMMLRQSSISPEMREKYLDILEQEWNREYDLIKDLLTLQSMESGELSYTPEELNLSQTIEGLAQSFNAKWQPEREIRLQANVENANLKINTDIESLENILSELLLNAAKYSDDNTLIELSAHSQTNLKGKSIVISVTNSGAEITPEELPHIFDKFRRGQGVTDRAVPGTGLGLALVQYLVEHLNGTIEVKSEPVDETSTTYLTTFILKLPQSQPSIS